MAGGEWRVAGGGWRVAGGGWRVAGGGWRVVEVEVVGCPTYKTVCTMVHVVSERRRSRLADLVKMGWPAGGCATHGSAGRADPVGAEVAGVGWPAEDWKD